MPTCRECSLYNLDGVKNARGAVMGNKGALCLWVSSEVWPESVNTALSKRPSAGWMPPNLIHKCGRFIKRKEPS